jgi:hypothetical protein
MFDSIKAANTPSGVDESSQWSKMPEKPENPNLPPEKIYSQGFFQFHYFLCFLFFFFFFFFLFYLVSFSLTLSFFLSNSFFLSFFLLFPVQIYNFFSLFLFIY